MQAATSEKRVGRPSGRHWRPTVPCRASISTVSRLGRIGGAAMRQLLDGSRAPSTDAPPPLLPHPLLHSSSPPLVLSSPRPSKPPHPPTMPPMISPPHAPTSMAVIKFYHPPDHRGAKTSGTRRQLYSCTCSCCGKRSSHGRDCCLLISR